MRFSLVTLIGLLMLGCDRQPAPAPVSNPPRASVQVRPLTPLLPRLATHLAIDSHGNVYWNQESVPPVAGGDLTYVMGDGSVPESIPALQIEQLLATVHLPGGVGAIRSIAVGPDDALYILFVATRGPTLVFDVLRYAPRDKQLTIVLDTKQVRISSRLGASLSLARGSLLSSRNALWLWVRHTDGYAILKISQQTDGTFQAGPLSLDPPTDAPDLQFNSDDEDLSAAPDGGLYYVDRPRSVLWRIAPEESVASVMFLTGAPKSITPPAVSKGHLVFLAGAAETFTTSESKLTDVATPFLDLDAAPPVLLEYDENRKALRSFDRSRLDVPANLPLQTLQPRQLIWDDSTASFITFDAGSGEILRLKISGD